MVLMIDNYDSFTFNLVQYLAELGAEVRVFRNDELTVESIETLAPSHLVLSPGPCTPNEAGITLQTIERLAGRIPILGVCLGHQAIGQAFGGKVVRAKQVMHGKVSRVRHDENGPFRKIPNGFVATRYHSLVVERSSLPACLQISAESEDGEIMGLRHRQLAVEGVQFHPEALLTEHGHKLLQNFLTENESGSII
jgi:anthranilate synthase/aminodeoxychorismate synthase-like glutamine amidotransferase